MGVVNLLEFFQELSVHALIEIFISHVTHHVIYHMLIKECLGERKEEGGRDMGGGGEVDMGGGRHGEGG